MEEPTIIHDTTAIQSPEDVIPVNHDVRTISIMVALFFIIAVPLYIMLVRAGSQPVSIKQQVANIKTSTQNPNNIPTPTIAPLVITREQDIDTALKMVDGTDTTSMANDLQQNTTDAATFSQ